MPSAVEEILSSRRDGAAADEAGREKKEKPELYTTVVDAEPQYAGMAGQCLYESCDCRFFTGESGRCGSCNHPNLYHLVKPNREDVQLRQAEDDRLRRLFVKRLMREQREVEEKRSREVAAHPVQAAANTFPCSVNACDCTRFTAPPQQQPAAASDTLDAAAAAVVAASPASPSSTLDVKAGASLSSPKPTAAVAASPSSSSLSSSTAAFTLAVDSARPTSASGTLTDRAVCASPSGAWGGSGWGSTSGSAGLSSAERASLLPRVCKKCRHAEMYHVRSAEDEDKKKAKAKASPKKK